MARVYSKHRAKKDALAEERELTKPKNLQEYYGKVLKEHGLDIPNTSFRDYIKAYNDERGWETSEFHLELADWLQQTGKSDERMLWAYRGSGKRHVVCLYVTYLLWQDPQDTILVVSAGLDLAERNSFFIKQILESFSWIEKAGLCPDRGDHWRKNSLTVERFNVDMRPSLKILSLEGKITGNRARVCILDDCEVPDNSATEGDREKTLRRCNELAMMATNFIVVGTPQSSQTIYDTMRAQVEYEFARFAVFKNGDEALGTQQPTAFINGTYQDMEWANKIRSKISTAEWNSQYLLIPDDNQSTRFDANMIKWFRSDIRVVWPQVGFQPAYNVRPSYYMGEDAETEIDQIVAYWDPASGTRNHDQRVLAIVARSTDNKAFVLGCWELPPIDESQSFYGQCEKVLIYLEQYNLHQIYVEQNFSITLASQLRETARRHGNRALTVTNVPRTISKANFIPMHVEPLLKSGNLYLHEDTRSTRKLLQQIKEFGPKIKHEDALDSVAGALSLLSFRSQLAGSLRDKASLGGMNTAIKINRHLPLGQGRRA